MGRQVKTGLDYFPFEIKFFNDIKVRKLIKYQGGRSVVIYACLLCNIYERGYYMVWDNELPFLVSEITGFEEGYIKEVINCCFSVGLFDKNLREKSNVITSKGIQERYDTISKLSKRKNQIKEFSLINSEETSIYSEEISINSEEIPINSGESAQSKVKKRKVKEIKVNPPIVPRRDQLENLFPEEKKDIPSEQVITGSEEKEKSSAKKEKEIIDCFHESCSGLPKVQIVTQSRRKSINARICDYGIEKVKEVIKLAGESKFLAGNNRNEWTADFDWILKPTNFVKILEGNYKDKDINNGKSNYQTGATGNNTPAQQATYNIQEAAGRLAKDFAEGNIPGVYR
jgi:hypothetical protein